MAGERGGRGGGVKHIGRHVDSSVRLLVTRVRPPPVVENLPICLNLLELGTLRTLAATARRATWLVVDGEAVRVCFALCRCQCDTSEQRGPTRF